MKFFRLFENWDGNPLYESHEPNLIGSLVADQPQDFLDAVNQIFTEGVKKKGKPITVKYTNEKNKKSETMVISPAPLKAGSDNTFTKVDSGYKEVLQYAKAYDKLILTYAGKTRKIRTPYGERICMLGTKDGFSRGKLNKLYLDRIYTLALCAELIKNIELIPKAAPGIGYEEMQIDNLDKGLSDIFKKVGKSKHQPLQLWINDQDMGVKINGGVKVEGVPKSDLSFGIDGKPGFWVSYKHGEYINDEGVVDKVSFQQYGSISSFFNKKFDDELKDLTGIRKLMSGFFRDARKRMMEIEGNGSYSFRGATKLEFPSDYKTIIVTHDGGETIIDNIKRDNVEQLSKNLPSFKTAVDESGFCDITILAKSGWSARKPIIDLGPVGVQITLLSIFGVNYGGKAGEDNVNVLMQDAAPFTIGLRLENDEVNGVNVQTSANGHVMFNPKMYGDSTQPPKFMEKYEPYMVLRYTGGLNQYFNEGGRPTGILGCRGLIMPKYHSKQDTDI